MNFRIFLTGSGICKKAQQLLKDENCTFEVGDPKDTPEEIAVKLSRFEPDGLIVRQGKITKIVIESARNLKVICKHGVGTDNIDIDTASKKGIPVLFTPMANYESVAEHTLALILALIRRIPSQDASIRSGKFEKSNFDGLELLGKHLGIIGFGRIGRRLAELVAPFNMRVIVYDPFDTKEILQSYIKKVQQPEDLFVQADIISLHCQLTPDTANIINELSIQQMKHGVIIINTARGGLINETDLFYALQKKRISGAALDVFEDEPPNLDNPLFQLDNTIYTSHVSGISDNSFVNMGIESVNNILSVLKKEQIDVNSVINKDVL
jgi:D-3-phosphoglycerate dehydrogenase